MFKERLSDIFNESTLNKFRLTTRYTGINQMYSFITTQETEAITLAYADGATLIQADGQGTLFTIETEVIEGGNT